MNDRFQVPSIKERGQLVRAVAAVQAFKPQAGENTGRIACPKRQRPALHDPGQRDLSRTVRGLGLHPLVQLKTENNMQRLWAIRHTTRSGSTWIDYTCIRSTRRECWREFEHHNEGATPAYLKRLARERRNGTTKAVKVIVREVSGG